MLCPAGAPVCYNMQNMANQGSLLERQGVEFSLRFNDVCSIDCTIGHVIEHSLWALCSRVGIPHGAKPQPSNPGLNVPGWPGPFWVISVVLTIRWTWRGPPCITKAFHLLRKFNGFSVYQTGPRTKARQILYYTQLFVSSTSLKTYIFLENLNNMIGTLTYIIAFIATII